MGPRPKSEWTLQAHTAMTHLRIGILLLALAACSDSAGPDGPGLPEPAQYTVRMVASADFPLDSAVVRMEGPTPHTFSMAEGEEVVVDSLAPGAYQVAVEGWRDEMIAGFTEFEETFEAGDRQERPVTFERAFAPEEASATLDAGMIQLQWDSVPGALEYHVEVKASPDAAEFEFEGRTEETSLQIGPFEAGTHTVSIQAVDPFGNAGHPAEMALTIEPDLFPVTVQVEEGGELPVGSVVSEPEGIHCGEGNDQCQAEFPAGEPVVLRHVWPEVDLPVTTVGGTAFGGWAGDCSGFDACVLTVDGPKEVVATAADELVQFWFIGFIYSSREGFLVPGAVTWLPTWEEPGRELWEYIWYNDGMNSYLEWGVRVAPGLRTTISSPVGPVNWLEGCESVEGNTCHIVVPPGPGGLGVQAVWEWSPPQGHSLIHIVRSEFGLVQSDVGGIYSHNEEGYPLSCGVPGGWFVCSQVYPDSTTVTLTAEPLSGYRFTGWTGGGCSGVEPCEVVMEEWTKVEASFEEIQGSLFPVTVQVKEGGELPVGSVVSEPEGILCGDGNAQCQAEFPAGEQVVLKHVWPEVHPDGTVGGTGFGGWAGDCSGFDSCALTVDGPKEVVATVADELARFTIEPWIRSSQGFDVPGNVYWDLTLEEPGAVCWQMIWFNDGANSPMRCEVRAAPGTRLTISSPVGPVDWSARFAGGTVESCESVEGNTCGIVMPPGISLMTPVWDWSPPQGHSLLQIARPEFGLVQSDVGGIYSHNEEGYPLSCGAPGGWWVCSQVYPDGTTVTLTAEPLSGYRFTGWTGGGCSGVEPCVIEMEEWTKVTPSFEEIEGPLGTGFGLDQFSPIPAGTFQMGSNGPLDERPIHTVNLTRDFYLQRTEVTQAQWQEIMGENPSRRVCDLCPVDHVSWDDIQTFLARLNAAYPDAGFRLPTEAQWEYAARAGTTGDFGGTGVLDEMGWYSENASHRTHPVALKFANAWGLYDMHGNVLEWVQDRYSATYYSESPTDDPTGPSSGVIRSAAMEGGPSRAGTPSTARVLRGGSWGSVAVNARSATRIGTAAEWGGGDYGFRLVRTR